jgi:SAM-dependent methyltransferase
MKPPERRWLIPALEAPPVASKDYWVNVHGKDDYEGVFSVGEDAGVRARIVSAVLNGKTPRRILLAGCGSRTDVQEELLRQAPPDTEIVATDFEPVIAVAAARFAHPRLTYTALEERPGFTACFDAVVSVNVLVDREDQVNRALVDEWATALVPSGRMVALLPIPWSGHEFAVLTGRDDLRACLDLEQSRWFERHQGVVEVEYTPLRLRRILKEAGLELEELAIVFLDDPRSRAQAQVHYGLDDPDISIYEQLVVARRPSRDPA